MKNEKVLIISDLHLTTNFIARKYFYLEKLFRRFDRIIINGDFWTAYYNTFDDFLNTKWNGLFPILKRKKTIYIYGNHDKEMWQDSRNNLFSVWQGNKYILDVGGLKYLITHGHQYLSDSISSPGFIKFWSFFKIDFFVYMIEAMFLHIFGRHVIIPMSKANIKVKKISKNLENIDYIVIGHTHWAEIDFENKFINSGLIHSSVADYVVVDNNGPHLVSERY